MLRISRPTLLKKLDSGEIPFHYVGSHRRDRFLPLANQAEIDEYLRQGEAEFEKLKDQWRANSSSLYRKLLAAKEAKRKQAA